MYDVGLGSLSFLWLRHIVLHLVEPQSPRESGVMESEYLCKSFHIQSPYLM